MNRAVLLLLMPVLTLAGCGEPEGPRFVPSKPGESSAAPADRPATDGALDRRNIETH